MSTSSLKNLFSRILAVLAIACTACLFTSCAFVQFLPAETKVITEPPTQLDGLALKGVKSILTHDEYAVDYLGRASLFKQVSHTRSIPTSLPHAASLARANGLDAFLLVDNIGARSQGVISSTFVYASFKVTLVSAANGAVIYQQTVFIEAPISNTPKLSNLEKAQMIANAFVASLRENLGQASVAVKPKASRDPPT